MMLADCYKAQEQQNFLDGLFFRIERHFAARGFERGPSENWSGWMARLEKHDAAVAQLRGLVQLHQRHRFDPHGLNGAERVELRAQVERWLNGRAGAT